MWLLLLNWEEELLLERKPVRPERRDSGQLGCCGRAAVNKELRKWSYVATVVLLWRLLAVGKMVAGVDLSAGEGPRRGWPWKEEDARLMESCYAGGEPRRNAGSTPRRRLGGSRRQICAGGRSVEMSCWRGLLGGEEAEVATDCCGSAKEGLPADLLEGAVEGGVMGI